MRLDNYSVAAYEALEPMEAEGDAPGFGAPAETPNPEPAVEEAVPAVGRERVGNAKPFGTRPGHHSGRAARLPCNPGD